MHLFKGLGIARTTKAERQKNKYEEKRSKQTRGADFTSLPPLPHDIHNRRDAGLLGGERGRQGRIPCPHLQRNMFRADAGRSTKEQHALRAACEKARGTGRWEWALFLSKGGNTTHHAVRVRLAVAAASVLEHGHGGRGEVASGGLLPSGVPRHLLLVGGGRRLPHGLAGVDALAPETLELGRDVGLKKKIFEGDGTLANRRNHRAGII